MADLPPLRRNIQVEESRFRFAVSESLMQKVGQSVNFINNFQYLDKGFYINGVYGQLGSGNGVDGFQFALYDIEILDAFCFNRDAGTSGTTELDIKVKADPNAGSWQSIFLTTPKITSGAASFVWNSTTIAAPNTTQPVLDPTKTDVDAGSAMRIDLISSMTGARNCGIVLMFRPR